MILTLKHFIFKVTVGVIFTTTFFGVIAQVVLTSVASASTDGINVHQQISNGDEPPVEVVTGGGTNDYVAPLIFNVAVKVTFNSAEITWATNEQSLGKVSWGENGDYRNGQISTEQFDLNHKAVISNLSSHKLYEFLIVAFDQSGNQRSYTGEFTTLEQPDLTPPHNVTGFVVTPNTDRMNLVWQNPSDSDFELVRVVRSDKFFARDPLSGVVVFEGSEQTAQDLTVNPGTVYYYTIFAKDHTGNYSSGALATAMIAWYSEVNDKHPPQLPVVDITLPKAPQGPSHPATIQDFTFTTNQGGLVVDSNHPTIPTGSDLRIEIDQKNLPSETAFLTLSAQNPAHNIPPTNYLFSYDNFINKYFVIIPAEVIRQAQELIISLFNSANLIIEEISSQLNVIFNVVQASNGEHQVGQAIVKKFFALALLILLVSMLLTFIWYYYRRWRYKKYASTQQKPFNLTKKKKYKQ